MNPMNIQNSNLTGFAVFSTRASQASPRRAWKQNQTVQEELDTMVLFLARRGAAAEKG